MTDRRALRILMVGPVPPPVTGKGTMVRATADGRYRNATILFVPTNFSKTMAETGSLSIAKVWRLLAMLLRTVAIRIRHRPQVLLFHPPGNERSLVARDAVVLVVLRPLFARTIFHLHGRGLAETIDGLPVGLRRLARRAFGRPDLALSPSQTILDELEPLAPRSTMLVPNGVRGGRVRATRRIPPHRTPRILFLNLIADYKGADLLVDATSDLRRRGVDVEVAFAGEFMSDDYRDAFLQRLTSAGVDDRVRILGVLEGDEKWAAMEWADIFCVPSAWESFGLALVEAASTGLPIVAADVPGPRDVLPHERAALLAPAGSAAELADALRRLIDDDELRDRLAAGARAIYESAYTLDAYWAAMDDAFAVIAHDLAEH